MAMDIEVKIAREIMENITRLKLPLYLDAITEGKGNCFPLALIAQCKRKEIWNELPHSVQLLISEECPTKIRQAVKEFMLVPKYDTIRNFKNNYEEVLALIDDLDWYDYWDKMSQDQVWVDSTFVQGAAWFLGHDILVVTTSGTESDPYMRISGNLSGENIHSSNTPLIIACKSNSHYQSVLPVNGWMCKSAIGCV